MKEIGGKAPPYIEGNLSTAFAARLIPQYESHIGVTKETLLLVVHLTKEIPHTNRVTKEKTPKLSQHVSHQGTVRLLIPCMHDESTFNPNHGRHQSWHSKDQVNLRKKARGKGIMLSDCILPNGRITLPPDISEAAIKAQGLDPQRCHATEFFEYGMNNDGYWKSENLISHILDVVIPIVELLYPPESYCALFFFDNATSYSCFTPDALRTKAINLGPGGDQASIRNTAFLDFQTSMLNAQSMSFSADHAKFPNQPKGLREVLKESGLWEPGLRLHCKDKQCSICKEIDKKRATIVKAQSCQKAKSE